MSKHLGSRLLAGFTLVTAAALLPATGASAAPAAPAEGTIRDAGAPDTIPGHYIVVLKDGASAAGVTAGARAGKVTQTYDAALNGYATTMSEQAARRVAADPSVAYVTPDRIAHASDTQAGPVWGLDRVDQRDRPLSHTYTSGPASNVTVYVLDTGVRMTHDEFGGRATSGYDFVDRDRDASDCAGHGTHVAATAAGQRFGVAKDAKIVSVRVLDCDGNGSYSAIIAGINWVTKHATGPSVAVMSLGGTADTALDNAVERSIAAGVTYAVAAGNDSRDACTKSPARAGAAITVAATTADDTRPRFSNYGRCVDIFAPGVGITSAGHRSDTATRTLDGTSMAAPHVAGAAALYLAQHPAATPQEVRDALIADATAGVVKNAQGSPNLLLHIGS